MYGTCAGSFYVLGGVLDVQFEIGEGILWQSIAYHRHSVVAALGQPTVAAEATVKLLMIPDAVKPRS